MFEELIKMKKKLQKVYLTYLEFIHSAKFMASSLSSLSEEIY